MIDQLNENKKRIMLDIQERIQDINRRVTVLLEDFKSDAGQSDKWKMQYAKKWIYFF